MQEAVFRGYMLSLCLLSHAKLQPQRLVPEGLRHSYSWEYPLVFYDYSPIQVRSSNFPSVLMFSKLFRNLAIRTLTFLSIFKYTN